MQIFTCPFCGPRDETEFHFAAEAGKKRPMPAETATDDEWAEYLYMNSASRGKAQEVWLHVTCGEFFLMTRDTVTRDVTAVTPLPGRNA
ncbi:sarcosine oxidase subunit delta [Paracoccus onubensis]|uniref:sarcosine oxidase subunit delta n=1 Tax=Paracoccus onubensis TaxID=1675788 RepID=UPI002730441B|nr:sarcosine oxidase subunit delta [Paracoccus onubensis]MDP0927973.1 sarcosine oxidase subunit delta [Paracoccus onubensis]